MSLIQSTLFAFMLGLGSIYHAAAQTTVTEDENYKHSNTIHQHNSTTLSEDSISLTDQRTHKQHSRKYVVAPTDSLPNSNVQGKKNKANYKNQFN